MRPPIASIVRALLGVSLVPAAACGCPAEPDDLTPSDYTVSGSVSGSGGGSDGSGSEDCAARCLGAPAVGKLRAAGFFESEISINGCSDNGDGSIHCSISTDCSAGRRPSEWASGPAPCASARDYWLATAELERASVAAFEELAAALRDHGAPSELIDRAIVAAEDERRHARATALLAGDEVEPEAAHTAKVPLSLFALAQLNAREGCVLEAFAAIQVAWQATHVRAPERAAILRQIALDEASHAELAWDVDVWLATRLSDEERRAIEREKCSAVGALPKLEQAAAWLEEVGLQALPALRILRDDFERSVKRAIA